jgi:hypothetical protein
MSHILQILHIQVLHILYCDSVNFSCEAPETANKNWVKEQGDCINQGLHVQMTMMLHSLRQEASAILCEGVQGKCTCSAHILRIHNSCMASTKHSRSDSDVHGVLKPNQVHHDE